MRNNERYLAFYPAVSQAFLVHSGEVRPKIVCHEKVTLCEIRSVPTAVDRTVSPTKILGFFIMEVPDIELHGI